MIIRDIVTYNRNMHTTTALILTTFLPVYDLHGLKEKRKRV